MERLFIALDMPRRIAGIKLGSSLILRDPDDEQRVREICGACFAVVVFTAELLS